MPKRNLIYDLGMSEGNDTEFYLAKGFSVVGVEADPLMFPKLQQRFATALASGTLQLEHKAAAEVSGQTVTFHSDISSQGHSSNRNVHGKSAGDLQPSQVTTTSWPELKQRFGVPYYLKMDIEGSEPEFIRGMLNSEEYPTFISTELMNFDPIELFNRLGYTHFRIINQIAHPSFPIPNPPLEGNLVQTPPHDHWSGLFGLELPGTRWFSFDEIRRVFELLHELSGYQTVTIGWLDCHAWMPQQRQVAA